jgi:hypothetical protein
MLHTPYFLRDQRLEVALLSLWVVSYTHLEVFFRRNDCAVVDCGLSWMEVGDWEGLR